MSNQAKEFQLHFSLLLPTFNIETFEKEFDFEFREDDREQHYCICSHIIHNICRFICLKTGMVFEVGNCCIKKELTRLGVIDKFKHRKKEHDKKQKIQKLLIEQEKDIDNKKQDLTLLFQEHDEIDTMHEWMLELIKIDDEIKELERIKIYHIQRIAEMYHLQTHKQCIGCKLYLLKKEDYKSKCKQCFRKSIV
jgi:hypothetical protein